MHPIGVENAHCLLCSAVFTVRWISDLNLQKSKHQYVLPGFNRNNYLVCSTVFHHEVNLCTTIKHTITNFKSIIPVNVCIMIME